MRQIGPEHIDVIFTALERQIGVMKGEQIGLIVCGGTALAALDLVLRTTKDVDVLGKVEVSENNGLVLHAMKELPDWLGKAAEKVGRDFDLPEDWLNLGPAAQMETGLPNGFKERLKESRFGEYLTIYYISREDQIHFKLYASLDRAGYHTEDLFALNPSEGEIESAAKWVLTQDVSEGFYLILRSFLKEHGYDDIAARI